MLNTRLQCIPIKVNCTWEIHSVKIYPSVLGGATLNMGIDLYWVCLVPTGIVKGDNTNPCINKCYRDFTQISTTVQGHQNSIMVYHNCYIINVSGQNIFVLHIELHWSDI
uniref:ORF51 n=1 Tax=Malaco herpesvirus 4 TaxID=3031800 RepID=A0AA48P8A6_9VIRU|nr:TPA_asm: ORF51 [Malaco herpesvirus 4]